MSFYTAPHEMSVQPVNRQPTPSSSKRKQLESQYTQATGKKRRSDVYDDDADDPEVGEDAAGGARHWTDEEKTKLFNWLMGPSEDEHFDALRTKKNTCFRDVSHLICDSLSLIPHLTLLYSAHWMHLVVAKPS
jgi:hypothetical protein